MLKKVRLKKEIYDCICKSKLDRISFEYLGVHSISYYKDYAKAKYFVIDTDIQYYDKNFYEIVEPDFLRGFILYDKHIESVPLVNLTIEDSLFDI